MLQLFNKTFWGFALGFVGILAVIFIGMATTVLSVVYGVPKEDAGAAVPGRGRGASTGSSGSSSRSTAAAS